MFASQTVFTLNQTSQYRRIARLYLHQDVRDAIRKNCGDKWVTDENNLYFVLLPKTCDIDLNIGAPQLANDDAPLSFHSRAILPALYGPATQLLKRLVHVCILHRNVAVDIE